ncbi:MAG: hypothetical protein JO360_17440 [Acidobacteria bacterium]|nr:hypothetical protein [Acidobacteriota bacterium]
MRLPLALFSLLLVCLLASNALAQGEKKETTKPATAAEVEKAEQILQRAVEALGGNAYLSVRSLTARGLYTQYREGRPEVPLSFVDYIVYPNRERTEFKGDGIKSVQTNTGETGWVFDGMTKNIKDMKAGQVADFKLSMRTSVDNLLRGLWRKEGAQLAYAGRREAGIGRRNEAVRLAYPDGFMVEFEFGAQDHLPAKVSYVRKKSETEESKEEDRMMQYLNLNGIFAPFVVDHFTDGVQQSRLNYNSIEFNAQIADSLFTRPATAKDVK